MQRPIGLMAGMTAVSFSALFVGCQQQKQGEVENSLTSTDDLASRTIERRAVEAVIWGKPAVNYDRMYQAMVHDAKAGEDSNKIAFWSRLPDWKNQTLTPNPGSIYLMPFFNTKDVGPVVLEIPPADEDPSLARSMTAGKPPSKMSVPRMSTKAIVAVFPRAPQDDTPKNKAAIQPLRGLCTAALHPQEQQ